MYITIKELLNEGAKGNKDRLQEAIILAQEYIEKITGQYFEKKERPYYFDGNNQKILHLPIFCLEIDYIKCVQLR